MSLAFYGKHVPSGKACSLQGFYSHGGKTATQGTLEGCYGMFDAMHLICGLESIVKEV